MDNPDQPGRRIDILANDQLVARFIYGAEQLKPYLQLFDSDGVQITNDGLTGRFPHHRGIFIGWKVESQLGSFDLWHMSNGGKMEVAEANASVSSDSATITALVDWRAGRADPDGNDLLIKEKRTLVISQPRNKVTQVDARFELTAIRPLALKGDLQHSGVHFRAANEVAEREKETMYLSAPEGVTRGSDIQWCRLFFPIGQKWHSALAMNAPSNPVEELSMRAYGRFGFFFKKPLDQDQTLTLNYRFLVSESKPPAQIDRAQARARSHRAYERFVRELSQNDPGELSPRAPEEPQAKQQPGRYAK